MASKAKSAKQMYEEGALTQGQYYYIDFLIDRDEEEGLSEEDIADAQDMIAQATVQQQQTITNRLQVLSAASHRSIFGSGDDARPAPFVPKVLPENDPYCDAPSTKKQCGYCSFMFYKNDGSVYVLQDETGIWRFPRHKYNPTKYQSHEVAQIALLSDFNIDYRNHDIFQCEPPLKLGPSLNPVFLINVDGVPLHAADTRYISSAWHLFNSDEWNKKQGKDFKYNSLTRKIVSDPAMKQCIQTNVLGM